MASKPDSDALRNGRRTGRSRTGDGRPLDADDATEGYSNRRIDHVQSYMNYQGSSFPTDNIPQLGYTDNGQRPPFHPPQVVPYGGKYMTSGYHPPPASITNSNSGNSTTENAADSFNQTKVSLGRDASIYQETSSNSVPVSVNVHVNMSPAGPFSPPNSYAHSASQSSSLSAHHPSDSRPTNSGPFTNDSQYHPREKDSHRQRPRKSRGPYTHDEEILFEDDEERVNQEASRRGNPKQTLKEEPYWKTNVQSEQQQRPRDPELEILSYARHMEGGRDRDEQDGHDRHAPHRRDRDSLHPERHISSQSAQPHPKPQRVEPSSNPSQHPWSNASDPHQSRRPSKQQQQWQPQIREQGDDRNDEKTPHGSPDTLHAGKARRPKGGGRPSETPLERRWPDQEDNLLREVPPKAPLNYNRQIQSSSPDSVETMRQEPQRVTRPPEKDRAEYQIQSMSVHRRKDDDERFRDPEADYSGTGTSAVNWLRTANSQPPRHGPPSINHPDVGPSLLPVSSKTYSSPPSYSQSTRQDPPVERRGERRGDFHPWKDAAYPAGEEDDHVRGKRRDRAEPADSAMKPASFKTQPHETFGTAVAAGPPLRRPEEPVTRSLSDPDHSSFQQSSLPNDVHNRHPQLHRHLTSPGDPAIPTTSYSTSRPPPPIQIPVPPRQGPYGPFPHVPSVDKVIPSLPHSVNTYENNLAQRMSYQASISTGPSYGPTSAYHAPLQSSNASVTTVPDKYTSIGNPCLLPVQRKKENEQGWIRRKPSTSTLEGHIPLYMASQIINQDTMPLWYPSPKLMGQDQTLRGIEVGDIGYLDDSGDFHTIFNIFFSYDANIYRGACPPPPYHFLPLPADPQEMVKHVEIQKRYHFASTNITRKMDQYARNEQYFMDRKLGRSGAICVLPHGCLSSTLRPKFFQMPHVKQYFKDNAPSWYQHASARQLIPSLLNGSLLFVRGTHKARTWGIATFKSKADIRQPHHITFSPSEFNRYEYQWDRFGEGWNTSVGPTSQELSALHPHEQPHLNQCVGIIASSVQLDDSTWQMYFAGNIRSPTAKRHRDTGLGRFLSRVSSMSSIRAEHRHVPSHMESLSEHQEESRQSNDWDLLRMEMR